MYAEQMRALRDGGVDLLLIETVFDTLNCKAAIFAAQDAAPELPLWLSFTAVDRSGRNLSAQTVEAFWISVEHAQPLVVGVNCSLGATEMRPYVEDLAAIAPTWVACHPNAGLPNALGEHDEKAGGHEPLPRRVRARRPRQHRRRLLRHDARARPADRRRGRRRGAARRSRAAPRDALQRHGAVRAPPRRGLEFRDGRRADERHRLRALPPARRGRRDAGGARRRDRAGARRREPPRREHGRRPARRRAGDDDVPQPRRDRARGRADPDHDRQLALDGARGGAQVHPGQGRRQLDLAQGGRGGVPRARAPRPPLRRGRRRHGVRRARARPTRSSARSRSASARTSSSRRRPASRPRT